jgi:hypothetical protein
MFQNRYTKGRGSQLSIFAVLSVFLAIFVLKSLPCRGATVTSSAPSSQQPQTQFNVDFSSAEDAYRDRNMKATTYHAARALMELHPSKEWWYGNVIDELNQALGMAAFREGRTADAGRYLIAAGKTPGSPQLDSFGPSMVLAQQLLNSGHTRVVIQYLDLVAKYWAQMPKSIIWRYSKSKPSVIVSFRAMDQRNAAQIENWKREIRAGKKPLLNNSDWNVFM